MKLTDYVETNKDYTIFIPMFTVCGEAYRSNQKQKVMTYSPYLL